MSCREFYTDAKPYFDIIKKHELVDQVIMSNDFIPDGEVANYFCAADVIVQPYKDATQSGVTQIAYHFEKPIITTNVGGLAEIVPDGVVGYVVEPVADQIAESIEKFYLQNKEIAFSENARTEKNKYSWENLINSINLLL
ncbi:MAG: glycosyltransferase [Bacteroidales bacterium]